MDNTIDMEAYNELKSIMGDTLNDVIKMFLNTMPELFNSLEEQINNNNAPEIFEIAHRIKSSCSSIGAIGLANAAQVIELAGRDGSTENTLANLVELKRLYAEVEPFLTSEIEQ